MQCNEPDPAPGGLSAPAPRLAGRGRGLRAALRDRQGPRRQARPAPRERRARAARAPPARAARARAGAPCAPGPRGEREPAPELLAEVAELLRAGKKINAIKRYREETGLSLKEAKDAVDALEAGGIPASGPSPAPSAAGDDEDIRDFLRAGKKIQAIKVYRERYGVGLKQAKDAVERM